MKNTFQKFKKIVFLIIFIVFWTITNPFLNLPHIVSIGLNLALTIVVIVFGYQLLAILRKEQIDSENNKNTD